MNNKREDIKFMPDGWHWKITPEQIEKIKERDRDTVNKVYFDNLDKFKRMAYKYCRNSKQYSFFKDCIQQIYVDMLYYDYTNSQTLFWSIRRSFHRAVGLPRVPILSLDLPFKYDSDLTLADLIPSNESLECEIDREEKNRRVLEIIAAQRHLTDKAKDILTAYAFGCLAYTGLFDYAYRKICYA